MDAAWGWVGRQLERRARLVLAVVVLLTAVLGAGIGRLEFETSQSSLISDETEVARANQRYQEAFGGEPMLVLLSGPTADLSQPAVLDELTALEDDLRATGAFRAVLGPVTALRFARDQLGIAPALLAATSEREQAAAPDDAARAEVAARYAERLAGEAGRLGAAGEQTLTNPAFVQFLLTEADGSIRSALRDNFIDDQHSLLVVRLQGNASIAEQGEAAELVRGIVAQHPLPGFEVLATGPPVLLQEINDYLQTGMATLGAFAAVVMAVLLFTFFRARWRLLSLAVVLLGLVWAFGVLGYLGVPLSMVTISGLPILLGLGVDFAVQAHNRFDETLHAGGDGPAATRAVMGRIAGVLTVAMVGAVVGVLALQLSQVPMIDDFSVLLAVGIAVLVVEALVVTTGLLLWRERHHPTPPTPPVGGRVERTVARITSLGPRWAVGLTVAGLAVGIAGLAVEGRTPIQTDPEAWVGADASSVQELTRLREGTGYSSELDLLVEADDVTSTEVVAWIDTFVRRSLAAHPDELVSGASFAGIASAVTGATPAAEDIDALLPIAPADVVTSFVTADGTQASIILPIANLSLEAREALLDELVADIDAPAGVTVTPAGLAVVGIELVSALEANRLAITLLALGLVAVWLLAAYRRPGPALLPLVPVIVAVGASSLAIYLLGFELTPLTTVSAPLAIAITTEFSVLLAAGFRQELERGAPPEQALAGAAQRIGRAFVASGLTLLGGFVVLALAPMPLLVDFGIVVGIDVALALLSVLVVLPPLLRRTAGSATSRHPAAHDGTVIDLTHQEVLT